MSENVKIEHIPPHGNYGPYYNACEGRTFETGGHKFHIFIHGGYNAGGLIGTEANGIGMVSVTDKRTVLDQHLRKGMGLDFREEKLKELLRIVDMNAKQLSLFFAAHPRARYNPLTVPALRKKLEKGSKKLDAKITSKIPEERFKATQFMTAKQKQLVARDWELFIVKRIVMKPEDLHETETGALFNGFTKTLYDYLYLHCGYIAHFNRAGFFEAQFRDTADFLRNLRQFAEGCDHIGLVLGRQSDYQDLNEVMIRVAKHYLPKAHEIYRQECKCSEDELVEQAKSLLERHGMKVVPA